MTNFITKIFISLFRNFSKIQSLIGSCHNPNKTRILYKIAGFYPCLLQRRKTRMHLKLAHPLALSHSCACYQHRESTFRTSYLSSNLKCKKGNFSPPTLLHLIAYKISRSLNSHQLESIGQFDPHY